MSIDGVRAADGRAVLLTRREARLQYPCAVRYGTAREEGAGNKTNKEYIMRDESWSISFARYAIVSYEYKLFGIFKRHALILMSLNVPRPSVGFSMMSDEEIMEAIRKRTGRHVINIDGYVM